jgi:GGDEF domain-containing protein
MNFEHDGLHDALTRLAAPPYFYESLRREIALANRAGSNLTAIRLILESDAPLYDASIISFADLITNSFRLEDAKARLGHFEFGVLIHGDGELASQLSQRFIARWAIEGVPNSVISYALAKYIVGEEAITFINRLDDQPLIRHDF